MLIVKPELEVLLPVHNEADSIEGTVRNFMTNFLPSTFAISDL